MSHIWNLPPLIALAMTVHGAPVASHPHDWHRSHTRAFGHCAKGPCIGHVPYAVPVALHDRRVQTKCLERD